MPRWFLQLSGGGWKGALQLPVIDHLLSLMGRLPDQVRGTSVGSINGVMVASQRVGELREIWNDIDDDSIVNGIKDFIRPTPLGKGGFFDFDPLRKQMSDRDIRIEGLKTRFGCGIWLPESNSHIVPTWTAKGPDGHGISLADGIVSSSAVCGIFEGAEILWKGGRFVGADGGHEHVCPPAPPGVVEGDIVDAIFCYPIESGIMTRSPKQVDGRIERLLWAADKAQHAPTRGDFATLQMMARIGIKVRVWAPREGTGGMLDASKQDIQRRFEIGERMRKSGPVWGNVS